MFLEIGDLSGDLGHLEDGGQQVGRDNALGGRLLSQLQHASELVNDQNVAQTQGPGRRAGGGRRCGALRAAATCRCGQLGGLTGKETNSRRVMAVSGRCPEPSD